MPQNCIDANSDELLNGLDVYLSYTSVVVTPLLLVLGQCGHDSPVTFEVFALNNPSTINSILVSEWQIQSWHDVHAKANACANESVDKN